MVDVAKNVAVCLAAEYDAVIAKSCGLGMCEIVANMHRFSVTIYPDGVEEFSLDGRPFLRFWPIEFETTYEDSGAYVMRAKQKYQKIGTGEIE